MLCEAIVRSNAQCVLLWHHGLDEGEIKQVRSATPKQTKFIVYNWDDPYSWRDPGSHVPKIAPYLHGALTCCTGTVERYRARSTVKNENRESFQYCLPGFDLDLANAAANELADDERFECDVSFMCTNLYEQLDRYKDQRVPRAQLCDALYKLHCDKKIVFHIYGPEFLQKRFEKSYKGYLQYAEQYRVMRQARIVLTTHVVADQSEGDYSNERTCVALGVGSVLASDLQPFFADQSGPFAFVIDIGDSVDEAIRSIENILKMDKEILEDLREQSRAIAAENVSWKSWAEKVDSTFRATIAQDNEDETSEKSGESESDETKNVHFRLAKQASSHAATGFINELTQNQNAGHGSGVAGGVVVSGPILPGTWEGEKADALNDEAMNEELKRQFNTTLWAPRVSENEKDNIPLDFERQSELNQLFGIVANTRGEFCATDSMAALQEIVRIIKLNPHLNINGALDEYCRRIDLAP